MLPIITFSCLWLNNVNKIIQGLNRNTLTQGPFSIQVTIYKYNPQPYIVNVLKYHGLCMDRGVTAITYLYKLHG